MARLKRTRDASPSSATRPPPAKRDGEANESATSPHSPTAAAAADQPSQSKAQETDDEPSQATTAPHTTSSQPKIPHEITTSDLTATPAPLQNGGYEQSPYWGFVVYRTTYASEPDWLAAKSKIAQLTYANRDVIEGEGGDLETCTLKYVSNSAELDCDGDEVSRDELLDRVRKIHNVNFVRREAREEEDEEEEEKGEGPLLRQDGLDESVFLVIDQDALDSLVGRDGKEPYVVAVDAVTTVSEMSNEDGVVEWDGTMMVAAGSIFDELYLRTVGRQVLIMGEIHPEAGEIWRGV